MKKYITILLLGTLFTQSTQTYQRTPYLTKWRITKLSIGVGVAAGVLIPPRRIHDIIWKAQVDRAIENELAPDNPFASLASSLGKSSLGSTFGYEMNKAEWETKNPDLPFSFDNGLRILGGVAAGLLTCLGLSTIKLLAR